ncbi:chondroitinase-B domain-containing protein [Flavobacterium sp.]|uniref:chondroitinase-B domain-containing protein n=1 Tax=Flavobacterium sp. TaxID=239 RepID=UPI003BD88214
MKNIYKISIFLFLLIPILFKGATINVSSIAALQTACNNSSSGDIIILANGTYLDVSLNINKSNITVKAQTPGGVFLNGTDDININGNYVTFSGFQFTSGDIGTNYLLEVFGNYNKLTHLNFSGYFAKKYIVISEGSKYNEITYCNIEKKPAAAALGCTIQISTSPTVIGYHKISYCSFQDYYGLGGDNGNEPIRIGLSSEYLNKSRTIVEHCYFNNTGLGDSESVSVKCQENVIRYCTFTNQQNAMLVFRNGDNNLAYSNFFINAGGIRVKEANNIFCYNNYFENSGVGSSADAITYVYVAPLIPPTSANPRTLNLSNINFVHNTFFNCGDIDLGGTGATSNTWANNIFKKSSGAIFNNANSETTWVGNIYQGNVGITIPSGMTNTNPFLVLNSEGYRGLSSNSPLNNANASYPAILDIPVLDDDPNLLFDISGQARPSTVTLKDVGCDEYTNGTTTNHPLTLSEVGPSYLMLSSPSFESNENNSILYPNPTKNSFQLKLPTNYNKGSIMVYQINGQLIQKMEIVSSLLDSENNISFDVSKYNDGIYFVQLQTESNTKSYKLIIKNKD